MRTTRPANIVGKVEGSGALTVQSDRVVAVILRDATEADPVLAIATQGTPSASAEQARSADSAAL